MTVKRPICAASALGASALALVFIIATIAAAELAGPHNAANNIGCFNYCHIIPEVKSPYWDHSPGDIDDTPTNVLCNSCHTATSGPYTMNHAPKAKTHSSLNLDDGYGNWTTECTDCHNPHYQEQLEWVNSGETDIYVATGSITGYSYDNIAKETTLSFITAISYKTGWDAAKLTKKTENYRRTIILPDVTCLSPDTTNDLSYQVIAVDESGKTITVNGDASEVLDNAALPSSFGIIYGQLIRQYIKTPGYLERVKFYENTAGGNGGFTDQSGTYSPKGICQVCHTQTKHWSPAALAAGDVHYPNTPCNDCHSHASGFAHGSSGSFSCMACHGHHVGYEFSPSEYSEGAGTTDTHASHTENGMDLACSACHDTDDFPSFTDGEDLGNTTVCYVCHHDGTVIATGVKITMPPPEWETGDVDCSGCHGNSPSYANDSPKANSHAVHSSFTCDKCHNATTQDGISINNFNKHLNDIYNLNPGSGVNFSYSFDSNGGTCSTISCHGDSNAIWGSSGCLGCHTIAQGNRAAIGPQFSANSHHVQGIAVENSHCYQCHWEANADGSINLTYHGGSSNSGDPVNLVIYGAGSRPLTYFDRGTAIAYTADGSRNEIAKLNDHCLGCHSDQNNDTEPFGDCNTPRQYAWDRNSIAARYSQNNTTTWGKYSTANYPNVAAKDITKAYSAHGNAINNGGGYSTSTGLDGTIPNTRGGYQNVLCYDCHNSHGSDASGTTTSYVTFDNTQTGGLFKNTTASKGGYAVSYVPEANADNSDKNPYATGAALCFDCHVSQYAADTPWGYQQTFGATAPILGYKDGVRFGTSYSGTKQRFAYRTGKTNQGGHMMASSSLKGLNGTHEGTEALYQINGLCTPCHDPHGISPSLGDNQDYGVPLLKGTWLTSPYKEDYPEMTGTKSGYKQVKELSDSFNERHWNTDRVTFDTNDDLHDSFGQISEDDSVFAGLCLRCHPKSNLTDGTDDSSATGWKGVDRQHETVKGWGSNNEHLFSCSKCHVPHNSGLPRLMQTNCLNFNHRQQVVTGGSPSSYSNTKGWGRFPGQSDHNFYDTLDACHEGSSASNDASWPDNQLWNNVTPW